MIDHNLNIRIIDFGFAIQAPKTKKLSIFCGTPQYIAPEIIKKGAYYGTRADCWSLGILLYVMLCGKFPFKGKDPFVSALNFLGYSDNDLYDKIIKG